MVAKMFGLGRFRPFRLWQEVGASQRKAGGFSMVLMPLAVMLIAAGCIGGGQPYPADYFPEMHYQSGIRYQEPPRLQPPAGSVPTKGTDVPVDPSQISAMRNPVTRTDATIAKGKTLYMTNCSMCHGQAGKGDGLVAAKFKNANATTLPNDLTLPATQSKTDGQIWGIITNGGLNMPRWGTLLTAEERWLLVGYIKSLR